MIRAVLSSALQALTRHAAIVLAVGIFAGLALPEVAKVLRPLLPPSVAGLLFLALLRIDWQELGRHASRIDSRLGNMSANGLAARRLRARRRRTAFRLVASTKR